MLKYVVMIVYHIRQVASFDFLQRMYHKLRDTEIETMSKPLICYSILSFR